MKSLLIAACVLTSFDTLARESVQMNPALKKTAIEAFLKEANNNQSATAKIIAQINEENTDGRNQNGSISLPVKKADIQVARLSHEMITNPWHYGYKSEDGKTCKAGGETAEFLILLNSTTGVHMALESDTVPFKVRVSESLSAVRKDGAEIEYCEDVAYDEKGEFIVAPTVIQVESIKAVEIQEKENEK